MKGSLTSFNYYYGNGTFSIESNGILAGIEIYFSGSPKITLNMPEHWQYKLDKYIILFPFASAHLTSKRWPYYNDLINLIEEKHIEQIKKKIIYRSNYRGTKEMDKLLGAFTSKYLDQLDYKDLNELIKLLEIDDNNLYNFYNGCGFIFKRKHKIHNRYRICLVY